MKKKISISKKIKVILAIIGMVVLGIGSYITLFWPATIFILFVGCCIVYNFYEEE